MMAIGLAFSACNGKQADQENADEMNQYTDSTTQKDSLSADTTHDKTTNAPADAGTEKK
ncbi:hypothetical protein [Pedobacter agri]|nr:hypothetical protein [Pedobacter agri]MDQ1142435.1 hypothetical protein [Pedobacter agri]